MDNAAAVWDMLQMAVRVPGPQGHPPCGVVSTTPKMHRVLKQIIASPTTVVTIAKTSDNASNLDASTLAYLHEKYGGTRLGSVVAGISPTDATTPTHLSYLIRTEIGRPSSSMRFRA